MTPFLDRTLLEATAFLFRRLPRLPGRILRWLGFEVFMAGHSHSPRWARLGVLPVRSRESGYWLLTNIGYSNQRYTYLTGRYIERHVSAFLARSLCPVDVAVGDELLAAVPAATRGVCKIDVEGYEMEV